MRDNLRGMRVVLGDDDFELRKGCGEVRSPLAGLVGLRRHHHEFGRHGGSSRLALVDHETSTAEVETRAATR